MSDRRRPEKSPEGYSYGLGHFQLGMIAIGGAIGVGLFLGTGGNLHRVGPSLWLAYALCGTAAFFVMRALGELVLYRPSSGSFVEYAGLFIGRWARFASGWMFWLNWAFTGIAELTATGTYVSLWAPGWPRWLTALIALAFVLTINLVSVNLFGDFESWFSMLKVLAIVGFLCVGLYAVLTAADMGHGASAGLGNLDGTGGFFPKGFGAALLGLQSVIFAYAAIEMVGIAAGETRDADRVVPKAINSVIVRIAVFYVGSVLLLALCLPWTAYSGQESPFVTVFGRLGIPGAADVMNFVVITAALSSSNSGLYSTGRILRQMADAGEAPKGIARMTANGVPYRAVLMTAAVYLFGVVLYYYVPTRAFDIATSVASLGVITTWITILACQIVYHRRTERGELPRSSFRMPGSPYSGYATIAFLLLCVVLMAFADLEQRVAFWSIPFLVVALAVGWRLVRSRGTR
ncbi:MULTISPECIES: amino acid permease [Actinomadura]|uniref:Amino acid permease n=1 Tax=Actinomadura yumaensis TaxID=111807 RepID=A0ABW2CSX4_9ACTN|nr:amino acid permease [Actinomadura sp. J1-007]